MRVTSNHHNKFNKYASQDTRRPTCSNPRECVFHRDEELFNKVLLFAVHCGCTSHTTSGDG